MRVCIFVLNEATVDSRIFRQAATFTSAGHETTILAVQRGDLPFVETKDGYAIRRIPTQYTWREGYPRLLGWPARVFGMKPPVRDIDVMAKKQEQSRAAAPPAPGVGAGAEPSHTVAGETAALTNAGSRLSPEQWIRWVRTGEGPGPRSWRGGESTKAARLQHAWEVAADSPGFVWRRIKRFIRIFVRLAKRTAIKTRRLLIRKLLLPTRYRQLDRRLAVEAVRLRADLYWANDVTTVRAAYAAARKTKAKCAYDAHEVIWDAPTVAPLQRKLWGWAERVNVRNVDRVSTVCEPIATVMERRYKIPRPAVILNCMRLAQTTPQPKKEDSPLNAYRKPGEKLVLFHGSISAWRGLEQLVQAVSLLPLEYRLLIMGYGPFKEKLIELAKADGAADRITFVPPVSPAEFPAWLAGADVGTIPYQRHGLNHEYSTPNKLFECMHMSVPIVVNDLPELKRIVGEVGFGIVADCSSPAEIAKAIQELLADPARYEEMRTRARAAAEATYNWERMTELILAALPS